MIEARGRHFLACGGRIGSVWVRGALPGWLGVAWPTGRRLNAVLSFGGPAPSADYVGRGGLPKSSNTT